MNPTKKFTILKNTPTHKKKKKKKKETEINKHPCCWKHPMNPSKKLNSFMGLFRKEGGDDAFFIP
jgi:hypothetical protein